MGTDWNKEEEDAWDNLKFDNGGFGGAASGSGSNNQQLTVNNNLYRPSTTTNSQNNDGWNNGKNNKKVKNDGWLGGGNNSYGSGGSSGNWTNNISNNLKHGVHHLPFFNPGQRFFGHTIYSLLERPKANFSDVVDRINCCWVPMTFIFFAGALSAQLFGIAGAEPIHCLESKELNDKEMAYAIDYCQSKNLYYVSPEEGIPWSNKEREKRQLGYYHWVPLMMFLQALAFMMPNFLWFHMNQLSGIEYVKFLIEATKLKNPGNMDPTHPERQKHLKSLAARISEAVLDRDAFMIRRFVGYRLIQPKGAFVSFLYVSIKLLYLGNACAQFLLLNTFIGGGYRWWGYDVLQALVNGANWQDSPVFPRLSLCDVPLRKLGDVTRHTLQCHLRINTYNEKVYLFIWWAILVVAAITFFNFLYYLVVLLLLPNSQECSVRHLLKERRHKPILQSVSRADRKLIKSFANDVLCKDGVLLFWFIETHAGTVVARELFSEVFETCKEQMHCDNDLLPCEIVVDGPGKKRGGSYSSDSSGTAETDAGDGWKQQRAIGLVTPSAPGLWAFNGHPKGGAVQFI